MMALEMEMPLGFVHLRLDLEEFIKLSP